MAPEIDKRHFGAALDVGAAPACDAPSLVASTSSAASSVLAKYVAKEMQAYVKASEALRTSLTSTTRSAVLVALGKGRGYE